MKPLVGAGIGGVLGAFLWAVIVWTTNYEIGYVAWAVGGLVGFGSALLGGSGQTNGVICGVIALLSILGGKFAIAYTTAESAKEKALVSAYKEVMKDAADFDEVKSEKEYPGFMVKHEYTDCRHAADISDAALDAFKEKTAPMLQRLFKDKPDCETWKASEQGRECRRLMDEAVSPLKTVGNMLRPIDLIFALLGIATAFKVGSYRKEQAAA
jgi:phosphate/sulfate permease